VDRERAGSLLVVVALTLEARALRRVAGAVVGTVGPGASELTRHGAVWLARRPTAILVTGLAGGCAPDVRTGELILATAVGPTAGGGWLAPDAALAARARAALDAAGLAHRAGPILTAPAIVESPAAKAECWRRSGALAIDMESAPVLAWASAAGVPAVVVRAVADGPADRLPAALAHAVSASGRLRWTAAFGWVAQPALLADGLRLWRRSHRALGRLGRFVDAFASEPHRRAP
jgi:adenosylhomocysteine nucleosidase